MRNFKKEKEEKKRKKKTLVAGTRISINLPEIYLNEKEFEKVFIQEDFFPLPLSLEQAGRPSSNNKFTEALVNQPRLAGWPTPRIEPT